MPAESSVYELVSFIMSSNLEIFLMSFSVPIGGTVVTAIALIIFNRKWILKKLTKCCKCSERSHSESNEELEDLEIEKMPERWTISHRSHSHSHHHNLHLHDETKV